MRFSIIILSYNNIHFLDDCLNSVKKQSFDDYEIIFSDDCSTNINKNEITKKFNCFSKYKLIFNDVNLGTVKNFNNAIKSSSGEIVIPLSIDDKFYNNDVLKTIDIFFKNNQCYIATALEEEYGETTKKLKPNNRKIKLFENMEKLYNFELRYYNFISGCNIYYLRKLFDEVGYFDENYFLIEDHHFILRVLEKKYKIYFINSVTLSYRINNYSQKRSNPLRKKDHYLLIDNYLMQKNSFYVKRCLKYSKKMMYASLIKKILYSILYFDVFFTRLYIKIAY